MTSQMPSNLGYSISTSFFPLTYTLSAPPPHFTAPIGWGQQDDGSGRKSGCSKRLHHAALRVSLLLHREEGRQRFAAWPLSVPGITGDGGRTRKEGGGTQRKREEQYLPVHKWDWTYGYLMRGEGRNWASRKMCERKKYKWEEEEGWRVREQRWGDGGYSHTICVTSLALFLSLLKSREHLRGSPLLHKTKKKNSQMYFLLTQRLQGHFFHCFSLCLLTFDLTDLSLHLSWLAL